MLPHSSTGIWFSAGPLAAAVDLAVGLRVGPEVVRRERERPAARPGVVEDRDDLRLQQVRVQQQEERRRRVDHVDRADAAVAEVLLREHEELPLRPVDQRVRRQALAVGQGRQQGVFPAAGGLEVGHQLLVEGPAAIHQRLVIGLGGLEQTGRVQAVASPVGAELLAEVLDRRTPRRRRSGGAATRPPRRPCRGRRRRPGPASRRWRGGASGRRPRRAAARRRRSRRGRRGRRRPRRTSPRPTARPGRGGPSQSGGCRPPSPGPAARPCRSAARRARRPRDDPR